EVRNIEQSVCAEPRQRSAILCSLNATPSQCVPLKPLFSQFSSCWREPEWTENCKLRTSWKLKKIIHPYHEARKGCTGEVDSLMNLELAGRMSFLGTEGA